MLVKHSWVFTRLIFWNNIARPLKFPCQIFHELILIYNDWIFHTSIISNWLFEYTLLVINGIINKKKNPFKYKHRTMRILKRKYIEMALKKGMTNWKSIYHAVTREYHKITHNNFSNVMNSNVVSSNTYQ